MLWFLVTDLKLTISTYDWLKKILSYQTCKLTIISTLFKCRCISKSIKSMQLISAYFNFPWVFVSGLEILSKMNCFIYLPYLTLIASSFLLLLDLALVGMLSFLASWFCIRKMTEKLSFLCKSSLASTHIFWITKNDCKNTFFIYLLSLSAINIRMDNSKSFRKNLVKYL